MNAEKIGKLSIRRNGGTPQRRRFNVLTKFGLDHNLGVYNNNIDAIGRALTERYFFCKDKSGPGFRNVYQPKQKSFQNKHFKHFHARVMQEMPCLPRLSHQQVVDRYTGSKRRIYADAHISLQQKAFSERDAMLRMFVKFEKQDLGKAPRGINPRDPRYNLELGRFLKHAEKPFFHAINKAYDSVTEHTVIKGLNSEESGKVLRAKWDRFNTPVALGADAEKFDAHVSVAALQFEHSFYTSLYPGSKKLKQLLGYQLDNRGVAYASDGTAKFRMKGKRSSGDLNTSLGNCLIMCGAIKAYADQKGIAVELANNGDDCVIFMEMHDLDRFRKGFDVWFKERGFAMTTETPVYEFEQVEFCQTKPVYVDDKWMMIRNHSAVLKKDPICLISIPNSKTYKKWLHAVGVGGCILNKGVPVQQAFYQCYRRHGIECSQGMIDHINKGNSLNTRIRGLDTKLEPQPISPETRVSYYYAFGVLPDEQIAIESSYNEMVIEDWREEIIEREYLDNDPGIKLLNNEISW